MEYSKKLSKIGTLNNLIKMKRTGNANELARKLDVSRAHVYRLIEEIKLLGAPVVYCRLNESYHYSHPFDIQINISVKVISYGEEINVAI